MFESFQDLFLSGLNISEPLPKGQPACVVLMAWKAGIELYMDNPRAVGVCHMVRRCPGHPNLYGRSTRHSWKGIPTVNLEPMLAKAHDAWQ